jgi:excisionase family DNA binding protein
MSHDTFQAVRPKIRYKRVYRPILGEREEIKRLTVSPRMAAEMLGMSNAGMYVLLNRKALPAYKLGSKTLILISDLKKFLTHLPPYEPRK